jgi:hypothetical protein
MRTVAAVFDTYAAASKAVGSLEAAGIPHSDISIVSNDATERGRYSTTTTRDDDHDGAAKGAGIGAAAGAGAGLLAGLGMLAIPGLGPVVAAGWLASTLVGAGAGAVTGGLLGSLTDAGIDEDDAHTYAEAVNRGGTLVTVRANEATYDRVVSILDDDGTVDLDDRERSWRSEGWTGRYTGSSASGAGAALENAAHKTGQAISDAASAAGSALGVSSSPTTRRDRSLTTKRVRSYTVV